MSWKTVPAPAIPQSLSAIANEMERTYIANEHWYRERETWWHAVSSIDAAIETEEDSG